MEPHSTPKPGPDGPCAGCTAQGPDDVQAMGCKSCQYFQPPKEEQASFVLYLVLTLVAMVGIGLLLRWLGIV